MFGNSYFAASYFGDRYFGQGLAIVVVTEPAQYPAWWQVPPLRTAAAVLERINPTPRRGKPRAGYLSRSGTTQSSRAQDRRAWKKL